MNCPERRAVMAIGFQSMKPVAIMSKVPHTRAQYSTFSSKE
jgi:hypothetical protein